MQVRKLIMPVVLLFTLAFSIPAWAQPGRGDKPHPRFEERFGELKARLNLNATQETQIRDIMKNSRMEAKTIRDANPDKAVRKPKMMELARKTDSQINAVLDDKQKESFKAFKAERKEQLKKRMKDDKEMREEMDENGIL